MSISRSPDKHIVVRKRIRFGFAVCLGWLSMTPAIATTLNDSEARGKRFYLTGISASGNSVDVVLGANESMRLPSSSVPCASCHGEDGLGRPEGGIVPSDITFQSLINAYGHRHENGRKHEAYRKDSIARAITQGIDPDGNQLDTAMPRYALSTEDTADLIAYLQRLPNDYDPGLSDTSITVGVLLANGQQLGNMSRAIQGIVSAYFDDINAQGGIYGRKIHFEAMDYKGDADVAVEEIRRSRAMKSVFAMVATLAGSSEQELLKLTESMQIPQIGPLTLFPEDKVGVGRSTFFVYPGIAQEARAMVDYSADVLNLKEAEMLVVGLEGKVFRVAAEAIDVQAHKRDFVPALKQAYRYGSFDGPSLVSQISKRPPDAIFYFGRDSDLPVLMQEVGRLQKRPAVFVSASLLGSELIRTVANSDSRVFITYSIAPGLQNNTREVLGLISKYRLPKTYLITQIAAFSGAKLLVEALKRTGRALSRQKLIYTLEHLYRFDNGQTSPLTFNANQHLGMHGVYVMPVKFGKYDAELARTVEAIDR